MQSNNMPILRAFRTAALSRNRSGSSVAFVHRWELPKLEMLHKITYVSDSSR